jgi:hypothetical protein
MAEEDAGLPVAMSNYQEAADRESVLRPYALAAYVEDRAFNRYP